MDTGPSYEGVIVRSRNDMIQLEVTKINADAARRPWAAPAAVG